MNLRSISCPLTNLPVRLKKFLSFATWNPFWWYSYPLYCKVLHGFKYVSLIGQDQGWYNITFLNKCIKNWMYFREWSDSPSGEKIQWKVLQRKQKLQSYPGGQVRKIHKLIFFVLSSKLSRNCLSGSDGRAWWWTGAADELNSFWRRHRQGINTSTLLPNSSSIASFIFGKRLLFPSMCTSTWQSTLAFYLLPPFSTPSIFLLMSIVYSSIFCYAFLLFHPPRHVKTIDQCKCDWKSNSPLRNILLIDSNGG